MGGRDIGGRLTEYAKTHVETIVKEYNKQRDKWKGYINQVIDKHDDAVSDVTDVFKKIAEERAEINQMKMIAFSVIGSAAISWIGAIVEFELFPKYLGKTEFKEFMTFSGWRVKTIKEYSEVMAKTFGDTVHENINHVFDHVLDAVWPSEKTQEMNQPLASAIDSGQLDSFKTLVENALSDASGLVTGQLGTLSENINKYRSPDGGGFGDVVLRDVKKVTPPPARIADDKYDDMLETKGQQMLDEYFDKLRQVYAKEWFYYGNNPVLGELPYLRFKFALEMWAVFILNRDWKYKTDFYSAPTRGGGMARRSEVSYWVTDDDDAYELSRILQGLESLAARELQANSKLNPRSPIPGTSGGYSQPIDPDADADRADAQALEDAARPGNFSDLGTFVTKSGETKQDLDNIKKWATNHPENRIKGGMDSRPRNLGTFAFPDSIFAD
jgi:hypothetical protein